MEQPLIDIMDKKDCTGCYACANSCPKECIDMVPDNLGFVYPHINFTQCIQCDTCETVCPVMNKKQTQGAEHERCFAIRSNNTQIRMNSSSGGVFSEIAQVIINEGGIVYGAIFDSGFGVEHTCAVSVSDLDGMRGSKIIQSQIKSAYKSVKRELAEGKKVLFTGTPCQIYGLYGYLGKKYENLLTQDMICHGVCSPAVFRCYLSEKIADYKAGMKSFSFRSKQYGWRDYRVKAFFEDGSVYNTPHSYDEMMRVYLRDYALRPSCYKCQFKGKQRISDITLADFWGAEYIIPQLDDDNGLSFVTCHSAKGLEYIEKIMPFVECKEVNYDDAIKYNPSGERSSNEPDNNASFCKDILSGRFKEVANQYCRISLKSRIKRRIKIVYKRLKYKNR